MLFGAFIIEKLRKCYLIEAKKYLLEKNIEKNIKNCYCENTYTAFEQN